MLKYSRNSVINKYIEIFTNSVIITTAVGISVMFDSVKI